MRIETKYGHVCKIRSIVLNFNSFGSDFFFLIYVVLFFSLRFNTLCHVLVLPSNLSSISSVESFLPSCYWLWFLFWVLCFLICRLSLYNPFFFVPNSISFSINSFYSLEEFCLIRVAFGIYCFWWWLYWAWLIDFQHPFHQPPRLCRSQEVCVFNWLFFKLQEWELNGPKRPIKR